MSSEAKEIKSDRLQENKGGDFYEGENYAIFSYLRKKQTKPCYFVTLECTLHRMNKLQ